MLAVAPHPTRAWAGTARLTTAVGGDWGARRRGGAAQEPTVPLCPFALSSVQCSMPDGRVMLPHLLLAVFAGLSIAVAAPTPQTPVYEVRRLVWNRQRPFLAPSRLLRPQLRTLDVHLIYASNDTRHRVVTAAIIRVPFDQVRRRSRPRASQRGPGQAAPLTRRPRAQIAQPLFLRREGMNDTLAIDDLHPANDLAGVCSAATPPGPEPGVGRAQPH